MCVVLELSDLAGGGCADVATFLVVGVNLRPLANVDGSRCVAGQTVLWPIPGGHRCDMSSLFVVDIDLLALLNSIADWHCDGPFLVQMDGLDGFTDRRPKSDFRQA